MQIPSLVMVLASVLLTSAAQLLLKTGASATHVRDALSSASVSTAAWSLATSPFILAGMLCFAASAVIWVMALARLDVSYAYPFVALGILITVAGGHLLLGEPMSLGRIGGVALITAGVIFLATSS